MRKISDLGCKKFYESYESNSELVLALNMVPALSFVPGSKVEFSFDFVIEETCGVLTVLDKSQSDLKKFEELTAYFQKCTLKGI